MNVQLNEVEDAEHEIFLNMLSSIVKSIGQSCQISSFFKYGSKQQMLQVTLWYLN